LNSPAKEKKRKVLKGKFVEKVAEKNRNVGGRLTGRKLRKGGEQ